MMLFLGHFGAGIVPTKASFAAAKNMGFEWADDSAFDMLDCNSLSTGDADVINTTLALIEPCLGKIKSTGQHWGRTNSKIEWCKNTCRPG